MAVPTAVTGRLLADGVGSDRVAFFPGASGQPFAREFDRAIVHSVRLANVCSSIFEANLGGFVGALRLMSYLTPDRLPVGYIVTRQGRFTPVDFPNRLRAQLSPKSIMGDPSDRADLLQGTLELLVLRSLAVEQWRHGYGIAEWIHGASAQALSIEEGALYPALHRMEVRGLLRADWRSSENNRRAKYYTLTAEGRRRLKETTAAWRRTSTAMNRVLEAT